MTVKPIIKTTKISSSLVNSLSIPYAIQQRLDRLDIPLDSAIEKAIAQYHPSQVSAALSHIESNYELIRSPRAIFLIELPKQKVAENKPLLPVYSASDFPGYTIQHLKVMYPNHWQHAARHFGIDINN